MKLEDLVGPHLLSGVEFGTVLGKGYNSDEAADVIIFILDMITYVAVEDPEDGYRSCMKEIYTVDTGLINTFQEQFVIGVMKEDNYTHIIDFIDPITKLPVLSIGTDHTDSYYPYFVGKFCPENMIINQLKQRIGYKIK